MSEDITAIAPSVPVGQAKFLVIRTNGRTCERWLIENRPLARKWAAVQLAASRGKGTVRIHPLTRMGRAA